jgi:hypothetical protein
MKLLRVHQRLPSNPLPDVAAEVHRQLDRLNLDVPQADVAITGGSRGIDQIPAIIRAVGDWLRDRGATPFLVPCMGSHSGATAAGQREMLEKLGMTEEATGLEIRASMDVVRLDSVATGDVYMDRHCYEAGAVVVVNRIKLHTSFSGAVQSGLTKMMVVGMGKIGSARTFHAVDTSRMGEALLEMGGKVIESGKILAGLAILEDGFDRIAELHGLRPDEILEQEPSLLERHRGYFPRLPVDSLTALIVDTIGKDFSGTGMDTNVIGRRGIPGCEDLPGPRILAIGALRLSAASGGNAIGIGLADFVTRSLRADMDEKKTYINVLTTGHMSRMKIPPTLDSDEELIRTIAKRYGRARWMFVPNTLHLGTLFVSEDLREEMQNHPACDVCGDPIELTFDTNGRHQLDFSQQGQFEHH